MAGSVKTTKKHFEIFKKECRYWIKRLGLLDWEVLFHHGDHEDEKKGDSLATAWMTGDSRICNLRLCKTWVEDDRSPELNNITIKKYAAHEVFHQLLTSLDSLARRRFTTKIEIDEAEHAIIQRLINAFTGPANAN